VLKRTGLFDGRDLSKLKLPLLEYCGCGQREHRRSSPRVAHPKNFCWQLGVVAMWLEACLAHFVGKRPMTKPVSIRLCSIRITLTIVVSK
jgi:hypothetical protein